MPTESFFVMLKFTAMRKVFVFFLILVNAILLFVAYQLLSPLVTASNAQLLVQTEGSSAVVTLNGKPVGSTPHTSDRLRPGDYTIKLTSEIEASSSAASTTSAKPKTFKVSWESNVKLTAGTQTVINRNFGPSDVFSAGEVLTLDKGSGLNLVTTPEGANITIEGKEVGKSPLSLEEKGKKVVKISQEGYFSRELTINIQDGYRLTISVNLALNPLLPLTEKEKKDNIRLLDLSTSNTALLSNTSEWADGVFYYDSKVASASSHLDLLLDSKGATFSATPKGWETKPKETKIANIGYLGKKDESVTDEAKKVFSQLISFITGSASATTTTPDGSQIQILDTPTGFLRVRSSPSTASSEITQVKPGEKYSLLEEKSGWFKIRVKEGQEGWVSGQYAKKL